MDNLDNLKKSKDTLKNYESLQNSLTLKICKKPMSWIINNPEKVIILIKNHKKNDGSEYSDHSKKSYIKYILVWLRDNVSDDIKKTDNYKKNHMLFNGYLYDYSLKLLNTYEKHEYSDKQKKALITQDELIEKRNMLGKINNKSSEYLLLCMYTYIPPARADYDRVKIYISPNKPSDGDKDKENYIIKESDEKMTLYLNEYKSSKIYKTNTTKLPRVLVDIINESLKSNEREYLFVTKQGKAYPDAKQYDKWANRCLCRIFGKDGLTLTMLRNIRISDMPDNAPITDKMKLAKGMMHNLLSQHYYKKNPDDIKEKNDIIVDENIIVKKKIIIKKK
jgi:hypothetical protein